MENRYIKKLLINCTNLVYVLTMTVLFVLCWNNFYIDSFNAQLASDRSIMVCLAYVIILVLLGKIYGAFEVGNPKLPGLIYSQGLSNAVGAVIIYLFSSLGYRDFLNPLPLIVLTAVQILVSAGISLIFNTMYFKAFKPKKTAVIYREKSDLLKIEELKLYKKNFSVEKYIENPSDNDIKRLKKELEDCEAVFVLGVSFNLRSALSKYCIDKNIKGYFSSEVNDIIMSGAKHMKMFSVPIVRVQRVTLSPEFLFAKRLFDIIVSLTSIIVTGSVMLLVALIIKLSDGGPVLYKQTRLTKDGKLFSMVKFRSMRVDAEKDGVARLAKEHDDRITPFGRFIRACRLDELPQLFNILTGDMTIVGPRPERPEIAAQYLKEMPEFDMRLQVKAGLTGYAQIYGRYNTEPYDKLQMDLMYINHISAFEDLKLMFATIKVLLMKSSTEGVADGQITAEKQIAAVSSGSEDKSV